jgi:exosortase/archaeosortase family protein
MSERSRRLDAALVMGAVVMLTLIYAPFLLWMGRMTAQSSQLAAGGLLVLFTMAICLLDVLDRQRMEPDVRPLGAGLLLAAVAPLWLAARLPGWLPVFAVLSFCLSFAAVVVFLFGPAGVREFLPALAGFLVFGLLLGLFPQLDWPLRSLAARQAGGLLAWLDVPVKLATLPGQTPVLFLAVRGHIFEVAAECNGFGLLASSLLLATVLGFQRRLPWLDKLQLLLVAALAGLLFNFLRIVAIALVAFRLPVSYSAIHEGLGTLFYFTGLAVTWLAAGRRKNE